MLATADQLQQLVSPIALYPDMLIAQILAASTFPTQVVDAARFVQQNPNLSGDALAAQVNAKPWDPSVRSLCQFPSVLQTMSQSLSWTSALGEAYYVQPQDVMTAIQVMRQRAMHAGTLKSTEQQSVSVQSAPPPSEGGPVVVQGSSAPPPQVIVIQPAQPNTVYVPTYNPSTVYGAPVPQPAGYSGYSGAAMLAAGVVGFGAGMLTSALINNGNNSWGTNWYGGNVVYNRGVYYSNSNYFVNRYPGYRPGYGPYPGYRPGYPGYPGYPNRPGYPGYPAYPNRPGYPAYPNRPGYPGYAGNRPGYPGYKPGYPGYKPGYPANYANRPNNLAATNPGMRPNFAKPGTYPNRTGTVNKTRPGTVGGLPANTNFGKTAGRPGTYKGQPGRPNGANLAATRPSKPMTRPSNNMMPNRTGMGGGNRSGNFSSRGFKPGASGQNRANAFKGKPAGGGQQARRNKRQ
ncbi:MAG TPA: DUF3300 domain-containing protein [Candidatus Binataceae bacterium]|jgi:hypothetical protein|nr:DUF3300 domain-containing protein [Candidatus Binataceae bacterium]